MKRPVAGLRRPAPNAGGMSPFTKGDEGALFA